MKSIISNFRYYVLAALAFIAFVGILSTPADELPLTEWLYGLLTSKAVGFGAIYVIVKLYKRWNAGGKIKELNDMLEEF